MSSPILFNNKSINNKMFKDLKLMEGHKRHYKVTLIREENFYRNFKIMLKTHYYIWKI
jgi:hypothetical protein